MSRGSRRSRRRGATFTAFVIVFAVILLANGVLYVGASQGAVRMAGEQERTSRLREAAFAAVRWAGRAAERGAQEGRATLTLSGARVEVRHQTLSTASGVTLRVVATALGVERRIQVAATLAAQDGRYLLDHYTVETAGAE